MIDRTFWVISCRFMNGPRCALAAGYSADLIIPTVTVVPIVRRRYWMLYVVWLALCAVLFVALQSAEDPRTRDDRISNPEARRLALAALRTTRWADHDVAHVAFSRHGEIGADPRWVVLCDARPRSGLREAVVVE